MQRIRRRFNTMFSAGGSRDGARVLVDNRERSFPVRANPVGGGDFVVPSAKGTYPTGRTAPGVPLPPRAQAALQNLITSLPRVTTAKLANVPLLTLDDPEYLNVLATSEQRVANKMADALVDSHVRVTLDKKSRREEIMAATAIFAHKARNARAFAVAFCGCDTGVVKHLEYRKKAGKRICTLNELSEVIDQSANLVNPRVHPHTTEENAARILGNASDLVTHFLRVTLTKNNTRNMVRAEFQGLAKSLHTDSDLMAAVQSGRNSGRGAYEFAAIQATDDAARRYAILLAGFAKFAQRIRNEDESRKEKASMVVQLASLALASAAPAMPVAMAFVSPTAQFLGDRLVGLVLSVRDYGDLRPRLLSSTIRYVEQQTEKDDRMYKRAPSRDDLLVRFKCLDRFKIQVENYLAFAF